MGKSINSNYYSVDFEQPYLGVMKRATFPSGKLPWILFNIINTTWVLYLD